MDEAAAVTLIPMTALGSGAGACMTGVKIYKGVEIHVRYEIVLNPQTGLEPDTLMYQYTLKNVSITAVNVGLRLELDTMICGVDGANISVDNGFSTVLSSALWRKRDYAVPPKWWVYDIPPVTGTPTLVGLGTVSGNPYGPPAVMPDVFEAARWNSVTGNSWSTGSGSINDSAVVFWWTGSGDETSVNHLLNSGDEWTVRTYYGLNQQNMLETPTVTPTVTSTFSSTPTLTCSSTVTQTFTATPTFSVTKTVTYTATQTPTATATVTQTFTQTPQPLFLTIIPNSPNPFSAEGTWLAYNITTDAYVDIRIYTVSGEQVRDLEPVFQQAGAKERFWDGRNDAGQSVASGVFIYKVKAVSLRREVQQVFSRCAAVR